MDLYLIVYFVGLVEPLFGLFLALTIISGLILIICGISQIDERQPFSGQVKKWMKIFAVVGVLCGFMAAAIPTEKTAYMMAGAYAVQKVVETKEAQALAAKVYKLVNDKIDEYNAEDEAIKARKQAAKK